MLKRIAILVVLLATPALAQQAPALVDPVVTAYSQLLNEANSRVAALSAQLQQATQAKATLEGRIGELEKQIAALKPTPAATPAPGGK